MWLTWKKDLSCALMIESDLKNRLVNKSVFLSV